MEIPTAISPQHTNATQVVNNPRKIITPPKNSTMPANQKTFPPPRPAYIRVQAAEPYEQLLASMAREHQTNHDSQNREGVRSILREFPKHVYDQSPEAAPLTNASDGDRLPCPKATPDPQTF